MFVSFTTNVYMGKGNVGLEKKAMTFQKRETVFAHEIFLRLFLSLSLFLRTCVVGNLSYYF